MVKVAVNSHDAILGVLSSPWGLLYVRALEGPRGFSSTTSTQPRKRQRGQCPTPLKTPLAARYLLVSCTLQNANPSPKHSPDPPDGPKNEQSQNRTPSKGGPLKSARDTRSTVLAVRPGHASATLLGPSPCAQTLQALAAYQSRTISPRPNLHP